MAAEGSHDAYALLVARHARAVRAVVLARLGVRDVDDLVQETFLRAFEGLRRLHQGDRFAAYACRIAQNLCVDTLRRRGAPVLSLDEVELEPPTVRGSGATAASCAAAITGDPTADGEDDRMPLLRRCVAALPESLREALLLFYFHDMSYGQVAATLGISEAAVNQRLTRARQQLRERLAGAHT